MSAALDFALGDESPSTLAAVRADMLRWAHQRDDPLPLHRVLGLSGAKATRLELRNSYLHQAAMLLMAESDWTRAGLLLEPLRKFSAMTWGSWWRLDEPPPHASELQRLLFKAFQQDDDPPLTHEGLYHLLTKQNPKTA